MGAYTITEMLQVRSTSILYRSRRNSDCAPLLIKTPRSERPSRREIERLQHEYEIARRLQGPYVVKTYSLEDFQGKPALISEDIQGHMLECLLGSPMEVATFLRLARELAAALGSIHAQGIIHRDLKPQNIIIEQRTGLPRLIDFGIASLLPQEQVPLRPPGLLEGTLAYMSPEQTGRMNRTVDWRTDFYSLGVIFYQMLTGQLPFQAADPLEWVHCHIARLPRSPAELVPDLPSILSDLVLKLLAKAAEERYQSAEGLQGDLEQCLEQWQATGRITPFALGARDASDRFQIPQKLYGREPESAEILSAFGRVVQRGRPELVLVSGYSGIGKSSLVNELHKPILGARGRFLSGKFDQYQRDIPYSTLVQAFRQLMQELLAQPQEDMGRWRERLQAALGPNGRLITEVIPQLERLLGPQPPVPELPLAEAQQRFQRVFHQLISVFSLPDSPLVLFLDDLQWADTASLKLLEYVLTQADTRHLLLIGAYRDNEVSPSHPLLRVVDEVRKAGTPVQPITLVPLSVEHLTQLVADTLHCCARSARPLAQWVYRKTAGNPFFTLQLLTTLHQEHLLTFERASATWQWDLARIDAQGLADDVVELMAAKLRRLPEGTQDVARLAACLGNSSEAFLLADLSGLREEVLHRVLWEAVREGLLLRLGETYRFLHDRVQQAAYSLIPEGERAQAHLRIGQRLLTTTAPEQLEESLFTIVQQLNQGAACLEAPAERQRLAELNLRAGRKAKRSTAYASAVGLLAAGMELLPGTCWEQCYELARDLYLERAQCEYLCGHLQEAETLFGPLLQHARTRVDEAHIRTVMMCLYEIRGEIDKSVESALAALGRFGIQLTAHPSPEQLQAEYERVWEQLQGRRIEDLLDLPPMSDPEALALAGVLLQLIVPAQLTDPHLLALVACHGVSLCLHHGNADASCQIYVYFGIVLCARFHRYQEGYRFGKLGYDLVETRGLVGFKGKALMSFGFVVLPWTRSLEAIGPMMRQAFEISIEAGDVIYAGYSGNNLLTWLLTKGAPLSELYHESEWLLDFVRRARLTISEELIIHIQGLVQGLRGQPGPLSQLGSAGAEERAVEERMGSNPALSFLYHVRRLQACVMSGREEAALHSLRRGQEVLWSCTSQMEVPEFYYYGALALASQARRAASPQRSQALEQLRAYAQQFSEWARSCPENFLAKSALVSAELAWLSGQLLEAEQLYEQALHAARESRLFHNEALTYERASRFYRERGFTLIANTYLREARAGYARWGAEGKVLQLERLHPFLAEQPAMVPNATIAVRVDQFDMHSVLAASQSISSHILLPQLQEKLLKLACEYSGAQEGYLLLGQGEDFALHAQATIGASGLQVRILEPPSPLEGSELLPRTLIRHAAQTRAKVILDDARAQTLFSGGEYLARTQPRSVLCLPILRQGRVVGLLYLENNLVTRAFTPDRLLVLELLAAQAAISLETAHLYSALHGSQQQLQAIIDNATTLIFGKDRQGRYLFANRQYLQVFKRTQEQVVGHTDWELHPRGPSARAHASDEQVFLTERPVDYEQQLSLEDGPHTYLVTKFPLRDARGSVHAVCGIATDITERKQAEREEHLLAEASRKLVASLDQATTVQAVVELAVPTLAEGSRLSLYDEEGALVPAASMGLTAPRSPLALEVPLEARGRSLGVLALYSAAGPYGPRDKALARELGRRAALALDNARLYREAQEAIELRDEFLSIASHELRTPLTPLKLQLQVMEKSLLGCPAQAQLSRRLEVGARHVDRLVQLIESLLDVARLSSGRIQLNPAPMDLAELLRDVLGRFGPLVDKAGCRLELQTWGEATGTWDRLRLEQVVVNLFTNALKFGPGQPVELEVSADARTVRLHVRDHGIGIAPEHQQRIFKRFERAVSARNYGGLGLGLYISRQIAQAHGGDLLVQSAPGAGSTFTLVLPRAPLADPALVPPVAGHST
jgi:PAS domain S-box-containing protein